MKSQNITAIDAKLIGQVPYIEAAAGSNSSYIFGYLFRGSSIQYGEDLYQQISALFAELPI